MAATAAPPGPKAHLLTGHLREFNRDPLGFLTRCAREYGDVVRLRYLHVPLVFLNHPDLIEAVLVTQNSSFIKGMDLREARQVLGNGLLTSEGEFWRRQRRLAQPAFHRDRIAAYSRVMTDYTEQMLAGWLPGEARNIHQDMMRLTLRIVAKTLFDADVAKDAPEVGAALEAVLEQFLARFNSGFLVPSYLPTPGNLRALRAIRRLDAVLYRIIGERRASGRNPGDLLSMLLEAQDEDGGRMTDQQLRDEVMTLFLAGHETTAIALSWSFYLLAQNPEAEASLAAELREVLGGRTPTMEDLARLVYTAKVVKESMRLYPPAWAISREAVRDCEAGGVRLRKGDNVFLCQWVMHRDPRYYERPDQFEPNRWTEAFTKSLPAFAYFPFGGGPRVCIGAAFAATEAALLLATISQKFHLALVPDHPVIPWPSVTLRPRRGIRAVLSRR